MVNPTDLMFVIGGKSDLSPDTAIKSAHGVRLAATMYPEAPITMSIEGYDDDPRELWEISEVRYFVVLFAAEMHALGLPPRFAERLTDESLKWGAVNIPT